VVPLKKGIVMKLNFFAPGKSDAINRANQDHLPQQVRKNEKKYENKDQKKK
jgi:hypothetical protein